MKFSQYSETRLAEENIVALRQFSRYRLTLVDSCSYCKRRVIALLNQISPEYPKLFSDIFGENSKEILLKCPTPVGDVAKNFATLFLSSLKKIVHIKFFLLTKINFYFS